MVLDHMSVAIKGDEIWEQRMARLRALDLVNGPPRKEFRFHVYPQLHAAMKDGNVEKFISFLENFSVAEWVSLSNILAMRGPSGNTLLHIAAGIENTDILQALLQVRPDQYPNFKLNLLGDSPLQVAARAGRIETARLLLSRKLYVDMENGVGNTALHEAVKKGDCKMTHLLLSHGSRSMYQKNGENRCPLYLAVETGQVEILKLLLENGHENFDLEILGLSPVCGAVKRKRLDMLKMMLEKKKKLFDLGDEGSGTPLHQAAYENFVEGVQFFVEEFPQSTYSGDKEGYLPIHVACKMGHLETIKELIRHWPDPEELLTGKKRQNILHVAAEHGRASVVKYMLGEPKLEKLINAKDIEGNTPLHVATIHWQPEVVLSLSRDCRVNLKLVNNDNSSALDIVDGQPEKVNASLREISDSVATLYALKKAKLLLLIALSTMAVAFTAGVYVTRSRRNWIAVVVLIIGTTAVSVILSLYVTLFFPLGYNSPLVRLSADQIIKGGILISRSVDRMNGHSVCSV